MSEDTEKDRGTEMAAQVRPDVMPPDDIQPVLCLLVEALEAVKVADWSAADPKMRANALILSRMINDHLEADRLN